MSQNINQIYIANPATSMQSTDLLYFGRSPYDTTDDFAIAFSDFAASITSGTVTAAQIQANAFTFGPDSGTADNYIVTLTPALASYLNGMFVIFNPANTNLTTSPVINVSSLGNISIVIENRGGVAIGDISNQTPCILQYDNNSGSFNLLNPVISNANAGDVLRGTNYWTVGDSGSLANAYEANIPIVQNYANDGLDPIFLVLTNIAHSNTGASTLQITNDGNSPFPITLSNGSALSGGEMIAGQSYFFYFNTLGTYVLVNPSNLGAVVASSLQFEPSTNGIIGTITNDDAGAGYVGEFVSSVIASGSAITLTTATPADITSISLTAGDWDVYGNYYLTGGSNVLSEGLGWTSLSSASAPDGSLYTAFNTNPAALLAQFGATTPFMRVSIATTTTVYLSCQAQFATSDCIAFGGIYARRVR